MLTGGGGCPSGEFGHPPFLCPHKAFQPLAERVARLYDSRMTSALAALAEQLFLFALFGVTGFTVTYTVQCLVLFTWRIFAYVTVYVLRDMWQAVCQLRYGNRYMGRHRNILWVNE